MAERLRVTQVIKGLGPGGAERLLVEAARAMPSTEVESSVVYALSYKDHLEGELREAGVVVEPLGVRRLADVRWVWRLRRVLRRLHPEVVHVHSPALAPVVRIGARLRLFGHPRPRVVTTEHNAWPTFHPVTRLANALTAPWDDRTLAVSDEVRDSVRPAPLRRRVTTVRHGIDVSRVRALGTHRDQVRADLGIGEGEVVVATIANYRAQKNYPVLLDAAARVVAADAHVRFVAVGQGPQAQEIDRHHRELGLGERFLLLGYRPDAATILAAADVFTLASDYEGLPVALMEALAHGLPVVATAVGGVAETIDDGCGILVAPRDPSALAAAILTIVRDPARRTRLAAGAAVVGDSFDAARAARALVDVYRAVTDRR